MMEGKKINWERKSLCILNAENTLETLTVKWHTNVVSLFGDQQKFQDPRSRADSQRYLFLWYIRHVQIEIEPVGETLKSGKN